MQSVNRLVGSQSSTFFPSKRSDHDGGVVKQQENNRKEMSGGITLEPLNLPATKSILWDRTAQGESETLHLQTKRKLEFLPREGPGLKPFRLNVRIFINEKTLRLAQRHIHRSTCSLDCFLIGSISADSGEDGLDITVDRFDPGREVLLNNGSAKVKRKVPTTVVPGDHIVPLTLIQGLSGAGNATTHAVEEFERALQVLYSRISGQEPVNLSHLVSLKACCHAHGSDNEIILNLQCGAVTMSTTIQATPVAPVPIIPTALARNLAGPLRLSEVQGVPKSGYLTMDHTRKLLLLLETDPKAFSLPLLGIWVSGVCSIHHPYIWACCLRYLYSTAIQQRVFAPPNSFILLVYTPVKRTPDFWECQRKQEQPVHDDFELLSCYENLHLEVPPGPGPSQPLCFELFPAPEEMSRSLFNQAADKWEQGHTAISASQTTALLPGNQTTVMSVTSPEAEEPNLVPRPSPSPHPQNIQQLILPIAEETSLSLSFEDHDSSGVHQQQGFVNQQVLQHSYPNTKLAKPQLQQRQRIRHDQENNRIVRAKGVMLNQSKRNVPQNSPSREPLKQILAPNQVQNVNENRRPVTVCHKQILLENTVAQNATSQRGIRGRQHNSSPKQVKGSQQVQARNISHRGGVGSSVVLHKQHALRPSSNPALQDADVDICMNPSLKSSAEALFLNQDHNEVSKIQEADPSWRTRKGLNLDENSPLGKTIKKHQLETVFEAETLEDSAVENMNQTGQDSFDQTRVPSEHSQRNTGAPKSMNEEKVMVNDGKERAVFKAGEQGEHEILVLKRDSRVKEQNVPNEHGKNQEEFVMIKPQRTAEQHSSGTVKDSGQFNDWLATDDLGTGATMEVQRPDPYELLIRQEVQLRELQQQIKLLLHQQNGPGRASNIMLTPPRTPNPDHHHKNCQSSPKHSQVSMTTTCTNTGTSLLLLSPVKTNGKKSAATSPIKNMEVAHTGFRCQRTPDSQRLDETKDLTERPNQKVSSHNESISPDELANQVLEPDDPSQTLTSSLKAVDLPSFHETSPCGLTSPGILGQAERVSMEASFTSPVLGESASVLMEERQKEAETKCDEKLASEENRKHFESNHISLLQKNERQFYDNLLDQVKILLLNQQTKQDSAASPEPIPQPEEPATTTHEPTREEVVMATLKELERITGSGCGTNDKSFKASMDTPLKQWPLHRSSSTSLIPDYPHINCVSLSVDETLDEVFSEADSIALKYLSDHQLQELRQTSSHHKNQGRSRAVTFSVLPDAEKSTFFGKLPVERELDYTWNNLSMATKEYLGRYSLGPQSMPASQDTNSVSVSKNVPSLSRTEREASSVLSNGFKPPPPTPEPTNEERDSQILDINRLKKLPKLF